MLLVRRSLLAFALVLGFASASLAQQRGTPEEAKQLALQAADYLRSKGPDAAIKSFNEPGGAWHKADLYVFVLNPDGLYLAGNPTLIGKNLADRSYIKEIIATKDERWVNYAIVNPTTQKEEPKTSYVIRIGDHILGVGAYKPAA